MDAKTPNKPENADKIAEARKLLKGLGCFDDGALQRATDGLKPRYNHKAQIRKIVARLGLDPEGDIAHRWTSLCDSFGKAHQRSFHRSLEVDDEFRTKYQRPFDTVIRAVASALEGRYAALMQRVEEIAAMPNRAEAVAAFAGEIPGALPLQWHFFKSLSTGDWLPHLARESLLGEPYTLPEESGSNFRYRLWPAGNYLLRMAESPDTATRMLVAQALRGVAASEHPDIHRDGIEIIAALPAEEAAPLADLAASWLGRKAQFGFLKAPERLVKKLAEVKQHDAALEVGRALLQIWNQNGEIASLYGRHLYEHHLPSAAQALTKACGEDALRLLMELLQQAGEITGRLRYDYHSSRPVGDDSAATHEVYNALLSAVRRSAEMLLGEDPSRIRSVIGILTSNPAKIFVRVALHVLAQNPAGAPELVEGYLLDPELIEATWAKNEYAALAVAWFPSLDYQKQQAILAVVDAKPDKYRDPWRQGFRRNHGTEPTVEDERVFEALTVRDALWNWRAVLPPDRRDAIERIGRERGDPDAWRQQFFAPEVSPLDASEFATRSVPEVAVFLKTWRPAEGEQQLHTVTALAQELRTAVSNDPDKYAAGADEFGGARPIYIRRILEALQSVAGNQRVFDWRNVLKLIEYTFGQFGKTINPTTLAVGDDKDWTWACKDACELLAAGLRQGADGIGYENDAHVRALVFCALKLAPKHPEPEDFEERYQRSPFFAAQATLRGIAIELCILLIWWLTRDVNTPIGAAPRDALQNLPDVRRALELEMADRSPDGRVPRAVVGRFLRMLFYFGEGWLKSTIPVLFPTDNDDLRRAAWRSHLGHDQAPVQELLTELHGCYSEDIALLAGTEGARDFQELYQERLADYLLVLYLWGALPDDLLHQFWQQATGGVRRHAMWFVGNQVSRPASEVPDHVKARALTYWENRLAEATQSNHPDAYRQELGAISQWCFHGQVDEAWLCEQLIRMLRAGFAPTDAYSVVEWLGKVAPRHVDRAAEALALLLRDPHVDQWAYMTHRDPIRVVLARRPRERRRRDCAPSAGDDQLPLVDRRNQLPRSSALFIGRRVICSHAELT